MADIAYSTDNPQKSNTPLGHVHDAMTWIETPELRKVSWGKLWITIGTRSPMARDNCEYRIGRNIRRVLLDCGGFGNDEVTLEYVVVEGEGRR